MLIETVDPDIAERIRLAESAELTWDPITGGRRAWICFEDDETYTLGSDPGGKRFEQIVQRTLEGHYYPADAVVVHGRFQQEGRQIRAGDRLVQSAPLLLGLGGPRLWSSVEVVLAATEHMPAGHRFRFGYVTTELHHGCGIWQAELTLIRDELSIRVRGTASPHSWLFWLGLPVARYFQRRAWRRAIEEFRKS
jgi:hypothetical protein